MRTLDALRVELDGGLIEASAGTGKTHTITSLFVRLLLERDLTIGQILVVTFTTAATAELRERIRSRLCRVLAALDGAGEDALLHDPRRRRPCARSRPAPGRAAGLRRGGDLHHPRALPAHPPEPRLRERRERGRRAASPTRIGCWRRSSPTTGPARSTMRPRTGCATSSPRGSARTSLSRWPGSASPIPRCRSSRRRAPPRRSRPPTPRSPPPRGPPPRSGARSEPV